MNTLLILEKAARTGGKLVLSYFHKESHITRKTSHQNLVTKADTACQALIQKVIAEEMTLLGVNDSEIGFIGEENLTTQGTLHSFIIDPIDGTNNFASGLDYFCISIAHIERNVVKGAVIYWPKKDVLYYAQAGSGAFKKEKDLPPIRLQVKGELLENSVLFTYLSSDNEMRKKSYVLFEKIIPAIRGARINGSICLDLMHLCDSENATHMVLSFRGYLWDVAAAYLIVKESGGIFTDHMGNNMIVDYADPKKKYSFIAGHYEVIKALVAHLK